MGKRLDTTIGPVEYDNLIAAVYPPVTTFMVTLDGSQGVLKRGTVLAGTKAEAKIMTTSLTPFAILADDTDTTGGDVAALAYRTGHFIKGGLIVAAAYELTAADIEALRGKGILVSDAIDPEYVAPEESDDDDSEDDQQQDG